MDTVLVLLRVVHIVGGIFWVGTATMLTFFLGPAMTSAGPAGGPVMAGLQKRGFMTALPIIAIVTMLAGFALIWRLSGGEFGAYARSTTGSTFTMAGGMAVIGFIVGMAVSRPNAMRAGAMMRQIAGADEAARPAMLAELAIIQRRAAIGSLVSTLFLLVAAAGMAIARYV